MTNNSDWTYISWESASVPPPDIDFCLPNFLAGSVGVLAAQAGIGKTSLLLQIGAAVATGKPVAGGFIPAPEKTGEVVYLSTEDSPDILRRRAYFLMRSLAEAGEEAHIKEVLSERLQFVSVRSDVPILLNTHTIGQGGIDRLIRLAKGKRLLILDPIRNFHFCDETNFSQMSLLFSVLNGITIETGCAILFSHHLPQPVSKFGFDEPLGALGSNAFINAARWVLNMTEMSFKEAARHDIPLRERKKYVRASLTKSNYGPALFSTWLKRSSAFEGIFETAALCHQSLETRCNDE